jgi:hypothetical protein
LSEEIFKATLECPVGVSDVSEPDVLRLDAEPPAGAGIPYNRRNTAAEMIPVPDAAGERCHLERCKGASHA